MKRFNIDFCRDLVEAQKQGKEKENDDKDDVDF